MNNNQRFVGELVVLFVLLAAVWGKASPQQETPAVIRAKRFEVIGSDNKPRAILSVENEDASRLCLLDKQGKKRISLYLAPDGSPGIQFIDSEGNVRAKILAGESGSDMRVYGAVVDGPEGRRIRSIGLRVSRQQTAELSVWDDTISSTGHVFGGKYRVQLAASNDGSTKFSLINGQSPERVRISIPSKASPTIEAFSKQNQTLWSLPQKRKP